MSCDVLWTVCATLSSKFKLKKISNHLALQFESKRLFPLIEHDGQNTAQSFYSKKENGKAHFFSKNLCIHLAHDR